MKLNHNKKRNTVFIYELLIKELAKATMNNVVEKKSQILSIIKESFSRGKLLRKELEIYKSFQDIENMNKTTIEKMISESKKHFGRLDRKKVFDEQTKVIGKINAALGAPSWNTFVTEFKKMATVNQILNQNLSPKNQVLLEEKLLQKLTANKEEERPFPNINNLAVKTFVDKFNNEYSASLNENQRTLLNKYISSYEDRGIELKAYLYEEIDRIKDYLSVNSQSQDKATSQKIKKIVERIDNYNQRKVDKAFIAEVMKIQSLVEEINN
tara:strand:- start:2467 stop:3273 length:807 start_codon:yes stop_codon:yes gene_type:complete